MIVLCAILAIGLSRQQIPTGVHYKKAPDAVNKLALAKLQKFYSSTMDNPADDGLGDQALICGPMLWGQLKNGAPNDLQNATKAKFIFPGISTGNALEGRVLKSQYSQSAIWLAMLLLKDKWKVEPTIREANPDEIKYYWAIISYDIEEPLYIADYGKAQALFNFNSDAKDPKVFFVDFVGKSKKK